MLDGNTSVPDFLEPLGVLRPEQFLRDDAGRVHGGDVQQGDVAIHAGFRIDITALTDFLTAIDGLAVLELIAREDGTSLFIKGGVLVVLRVAHRKRKLVDLTRIAHIAIAECILRTFVVAEDDTGGQGVGSVVDRHSRHVCQNFTGDEVSLSGVEDGLGSNDIVVAVFGDFLPHALRHRLVPGKTELLVMDTQLNLPLLQALLLRAEVINVRIRDVIGLAKEAVVALGLLFTADDFL